MLAPDAPVPVDRLEPLTWAEYDGLRMFQVLLNPYDVPADRITIDIQSMLTKHPGWMESLRSAFDWISRTCYAYERAGILTAPDVPSAPRRPRSAKLSAEQVATVRELRARGITLQQISRTTGIGMATISRHTRDIEAEGAAVRRRLPAAKRAEIQRLLKAGTGASKIAELVGVSRSCVYWYREPRRNGSRRPAPPRGD